MRLVMVLVLKTHAQIALLIGVVLNRAAMFVLRVTRSLAENPSVSWRLARWPIWTLLRLGSALISVAEVVLVHAVGVAALAKEGEE